MPVKMSLIFTDAGAGWTETYYFTTPNTYDPRVITETVARERVKVLGAGIKLYAARINDVSTPKKVQLIIKGYEGAAKATKDDSGNSKFADQAHACVLMPYRTEKGQLRYVTLSGIPDDYISRTVDAEVMHLSPLGIEKVGKFYDFLLRAPWGLLVKEKKSVGEFAPKAITAITQAASGQYKITPAALVVVPGDKVVLTGLKGNNLVNARGTRKVTALGEVDFTIDRGPRADLGLIVYQNGAFVRKVGYDFNAATESAESYLISTRKRGRPFARRRGRRSVSK